MPVMPFEDTVGKDGTLSPLHIVSEVPKENVGVTTGLTTTAKFAGVAHMPEDGVNV